MDKTDPLYPIIKIIQKIESKVEAIENSLVEETQIDNIMHKVKSHSESIKYLNDKLTLTSGMNPSITPKQEHQCVTDCDGREHYCAVEIDSMDKTICELHEVYLAVDKAIIDARINHGFEIGIPRSIVDAWEKYRNEQ